MRQTLSHMLDRRHIWTAAPSTDGFNAPNASGKLKLSMYNLSMASCLETTQPHTYQTIVFLYHNISR
jgi:uncharacterized damage-inducible protein DinB